MLLKKQKPLQYILNKTYFYGLPFEVNKYTIIPRNETEELVEWILRSIPKDDSLKILDIGTGSGCIAISLKKHLPRCYITALDISHQALKVAERNAKLNSVKIHFQQMDILREVPNDTFDMIVSNPPYVRNIEKKWMKKNVLLYEPHIALFVEDSNPLLFYERICSIAPMLLKRKGYIFFEINEYLSKQMPILIEQKGFKNFILKKDIYGKYRMIKICSCR